MSNIIQKIIVTVAQVAVIPYALSTKKVNLRRHQINEFQRVEIDYSLEDREGNEEGVPWWPDGRTSQQKRESR